MTTRFRPSRTWTEPDRAAPWIHGPTGRAATARRSPAEASAADGGSPGMGVDVPPAHVKTPPPSTRV